MKKTDTEWGIVDIISHYRHDWMNRLQLIKGNLSLEKFDRVNEIVDEIIIEAQQESKLCNLKAPEFASLLMTFSWESHPFTLEYEVLGEISDLSLFERKMISFCSGLFRMLDECADCKTENHLVVSIETKNLNGQTGFIFDFQGMITDSEKLASFFYKCEEDGISLINLDIHTYEWTAALVFTS
ncbi:sporulation initiation phosphotransferase B [Metabacillus sp. GX 13764]|uniref:Spo0B C-terminal domain-containing protein n=1 Tax=Metabacillus kandeliae TaxID=2900151 RepID=UPI001E3B5585|nr:Spo0B C-terminal domain-containing protein [Metabacillus kandeliae]MCD7032934.1 sporulation initiation phosphotransferase B [Metabacillus kandeliae]